MAGDGKLSTQVIDWFFHLPVYDQYWVEFAPITNTEEYMLNVAYTQFDSFDNYVRFNYSIICRAIQCTIEEEGFRDGFLSAGSVLRRSQSMVGQYSQSLGFMGQDLEYKPPPPHTQGDLNLSSEQKKIQRFWKTYKVNLVKKEK